MICKRCASEKVYYHGTSKESAAKSIQTKGLLEPPDIGTRKTQLTPVKGKVYLTSELSYAIIYALGGDMAGNKIPDRWFETEGPYGYVFVVPASGITSAMQPDEDVVGQMINQLANPTSSVYHYDNLPQWLLMLASKVLSDRQYANVTNKYAEYAHEAAAGKKVLKHMSPAQKLQLLESSNHVAHEGAVKPSECWRIDKRRSPELKKDGSNFFQLAERCGTTTAMRKQAFAYDSDDMRDAFDHLNMQIEDDGGELLTDENTDITYKSDMPVSEILSHSDYRSWGEFAKGSLLGLDREEFVDEVSGYRGEDWATRAWEWAEQGNLDNPVILYLGDKTMEQVADGQGRINIAVGLGWKTLPTVIIHDKAIKTAAGLVDLHGLDTLLSKKAATALNTAWKRLNDEVEPIPDYETLLIHEIRFYKIIKQELFNNGLVKSPTDLYSNHKHISDFIDEPILKTESADDLFSKTAVHFGTYINNKATTLGSFSPDDYTSRSNTSVTVNLGVILHRLLTIKGGGYLIDRDFYMPIKNTLGHELLHAADWAYQQFGKRNKYRELNPTIERGTDPDHAKYMNKDTELKSWAYNAFREFWEFYDPSTARDYRELLEMSSEEFFKRFNSLRRKDWVDKILPENRKKFIQRVLKTIQREAVKALQKIEEQNKLKYPRDPDAYQFGKYKDRWTV